MEKGMEVWGNNLSHDYTSILNIIMTDKKKQIDWKIVCTGILALAGLEIYALSQGVNGTLFSVVIAMIGLVIGVTIENPFKVK